VYVREAEAVAVAEPDAVTVAGTVLVVFPTLDSVVTCHPQFESHQLTDGVYTVAVPVDDLAPLTVPVAVRIRVEVPL
jgi:hypothetical protein